MVDATAILDRARAGELGSLGDDTSALAQAVRTLAQEGKPDAALELVGRTWRIWMSRGEVAEGSAVAAAALDAPGAAAPSVWRTRTLYADGLFAFRAGDTDRSRRRNEEALQIARSTADVQGECEAITGLARVALREGRYADVVSLARQGRARAQDAGDRAAEAAPLHLHAAGERLLGRYRAAKDLYLQSAELNRGLGNEAWVSMEQHNLGWVELHLGDADAATSRFQARDEAVAGDPLAGAWSELSWSGVAIARGDIDEAKRRYDAGMQMLGKLQMTADPDDASELAWLKEGLGR
jgi:tetratricopeptide (TPR) repeat protein